MTLQEAVITALDWCKQNSVPIPNDITRDARHLGLLPYAVKLAGDYPSIRDRLYDAVYSSVEGYLSGDSTVRVYQNELKRALVETYTEASEAAYIDGGGSLPIDQDTSAYITAEMNAQLSYVESLFQSLKGLKKEGGFDAGEEAVGAAERWALGLDGFFNAVKLQAAGNLMLTWQLGNAEKHCKDCLRLNGQRHRASWYSSRGYTPRKGGSATECGGWNCDCVLLTDGGEEFTI